MTKRFCSDYTSVIRFDIDKLQDAKNAGAIARMIGHKTRLVYRGPRRKVKHWSGHEIVAASTLKADAFAVDLYIYN